MERSRATDADWPVARVVCPRPVDEWGNIPLKHILQPDLLPPMEERLQRFPNFAPLTVPARTTQRVLLDMRELTNAYPVLTVSGGKGSRLQMVSAESPFTGVYEVHAGDPKVYVRIKGVWFQRGTPETGVPSLSFALPLALQGAQGRYEIPFGAIDRPLNRREEVPALQWAQVTGKSGDTEAGCLLLNDCKYGHSLEDNTLRLTLIRGSYDPDILPEIGKHEINLAIRPFTGGTLPLETAIAEGQAFNQPLRLISADAHEGQLPLHGRFLRVTPASASLCGVKQAEDGKGLVVRLFNPTDSRVTAKLEFGGDNGVLPPPAAAGELDLLERPQTPTKVTLKGRSVSAPIPPHGIVTLLLDIPQRKPA